MTKFAVQVLLQSFNRLNQERQLVVKKRELKIISFFDANFCTFSFQIDRPEVV